YSAQLVSVSSSASASFLSSEGSSSSSSAKVSLCSFATQFLSARAWPFSSRPAPLNSTAAPCPYRLAAFSPPLILLAGFPSELAKMTLVYALVSRQKTVLAEYTATSGESIVSAASDVLTPFLSMNNETTLGLKPVSRLSREVGRLLKPQVRGTRHEALTAVEGGNSIESTTSLFGQSNVAGHPLGVAPPDFVDSCFENRCVCLPIPPLPLFDDRRQQALEASA
ncbi:hypothetical protein ACHAWF_014358, partial [Thalassiosira exigua]